MSRSILVAISVGLLVGACQTGPSVELPIRCSFDDAPEAGLPSGWRTAETNGRGMPGAWAVRAESGGRIVRLVETENAEDTFNLLLTDDVFPSDLTVSVRVRADAGNEDQGGGVLWRAGGANDYYVARWNPLEDNVRAYHVVGGRRTLIANADVEADRRAWHELTVSARGSTTEVGFDGTTVMRFEDDTLRGPGRIGLWTKADAETSFDELRVDRSR
ncbi:MAG: DUF1080 domain-containing protein [Planctomycetes bacterium]|nr:DUF1080 domain-containing protein [Planctomycetota bacterium]